VEKKKALEQAISWKGRKEGRKGTAKQCRKAKNCSWCIK